MSDATAAGSAPGGFLEGLTEGFQGGYGFREGVKGRRRALQLQADLMTLREQEAARASAQAGREQTVFDEQQAAYRRAEALRAEIAARLGTPAKQTLGEYLQGRPGTRRPGAAPLSPEAVTAQHVGRTLGEFGGRELSDDEALLVGSGEVPYQAIAPRTYHPRTRAEWLENLRLAAGIRAQGTRLPITMDHAFGVLDRIYTVQDPKSGAWVSKLTPGERLRIAKKMVEGTVQPGDFPDIQEGAGAAPTSTAPTPGHRNLLQRIGDVFTGGPDQAGAAPAAPTSGRAPVRGDLHIGDQGVTQDRVEQARQLIGQYHDLPSADLEAALREQGYDEEEIRLILGTPGP